MFKNTVFPAKRRSPPERKQNGGRAPQAASRGFPWGSEDGAAPTRRTTRLAGTKTRQWGPPAGSVSYPSPKQWRQVTNKPAGRYDVRTGCHCCSAGLRSPQVPAPPFLLPLCALGGWGGGWGCNKGSVWDPPWIISSWFSSQVAQKYLVDIWD